ncbi:restriction endonuclease [Paenibacillus oenotherae]|uniref:Restriction endonuclease n=1 Tax=Paenibacillus oenotherae TaxID=1435645 RepID=A0ABS7D1Y4_9BACL|nr:restriction endonuclease [Paenibacillus oenotherae]MBW7473944.1 restriction endonuclease [Paenibacillus oenotherae]
MPNYDFHTLLEPLEFEGLVCDVVQQREGIFLETYREGPDSGIDGLYRDRNNKKTIVQAKRYKDFNRLYRDLKHFELPKVRKLNPYRYILGVSIDFRPGQKEKIKELFSEYISSESDILSNTNMNRLLKEPKYEWIIQAYPKLWMPNINIFKKILNESIHRAAYKESAEELKEALKTSKVFVPTRIYREALHKWSQNHVIILSGEPGVGKTSMAYLLALAYLQPNSLDGFVWANSINDVFDMIDDEKKQVIILDDFWGSIFHEEYMRRNNENRLNKIIRRIIESDGKKRLILTTREYVLQQGLQKHPELRDTLDQYSIICTMEEYGYDEKASILFRHLYASKLKYEFVNHLFMEYKKIIYNENYNPRVLAIFLNKEPDSDCSPEDYYEELCDYFDNPGAFWEYIFKELSPEAKMVALLLLISSTPMRLTDMKSCYIKYIQNSTNQTKVMNLGECIAELEKTMIKSFYSDEEEEILLKFNMPAVQDFLYSYITKNSEQCIPSILQCCAFYNQLQFLLEYQSKNCSEKILKLIEQECILHYHDYNYCYVEYDGSWNWDMDLDLDLFNQNEELHRFFHLLRCCKPEKHIELYHFLESEINDYCLTMGSGDLEAQYADLHNLPGIIVNCIEKGMTFNGKDIIDKYCEAAFSVHHYSAIKEFQKVFPKEYSISYSAYFHKIKKRLKSSILSELELLDELCMDVELDVLIDSIPDILKEFDLRYTKQFGQKIISLCGREPIAMTGNKDSLKKPSHEYIDREQQAHEVVKEDAENWLLGPTEEYLDEDQIIEFISKSTLNPALKTKMNQVLNTGAPQHIFNLLQTKKSIELFFAALSPSMHIYHEQESSLSMIMLSHIGQDNRELMKKLINFCAETFNIIMYQQEPILRVNEFLSSDIYNHYLKNDAPLHVVVFEHLIIRDEQWVRFLHLPLFIFCYVFVWSITNNDDELEGGEENYHSLWGNNSFKYKRITIFDSRPEVNIYYAEYGSYHFTCYEWERCIYKMFEELTPFHFNKSYVEPMLKTYLDKLGNGDDDSKVLNHLSLCRIEIKYSKSGANHSSSCLISDELSLIEHLEIAEVLDAYPRLITKSKLKQLQKDEIICEKDSDTWNILIYKIEDIELLKELGIYDELLEFVKKVERIYTRFMNGDYSQI